MCYGDVYDVRKAYIQLTRSSSTTARCKCVITMATAYKILVNAVQLHASNAGLQ
ncbi:hypothetical protein LSAT2_008083, partial [Lamellibrachia satsuma]